MSRAALQTDLAIHRFGLTDDDAPVLVLLHGLTDSGMGWAGAVRQWGDRFAIIAPDHRGHGQSPRFTHQELGTHPGEVMVQDVTALFEQLLRPVVLGHSLGGAIALTVAVRRPELVRALVLEDPASLNPDEPQRSAEWGKQFADGVAMSRKTSGDEALLALRKEQHPDWPEDELLPTGRAEQQVQLAYLSTGDHKPVTPWPELYADLDVPTLVVTGDRWDEVVVGAEIEHGLKQLANPRVSLERIPGAAHCVRREQPGPFYAAVEAWWSGLPPSAPG